MFSTLIPSSARMLRTGTSKFGVSARNSSSLKAVLASQMDSKRAALVDMKKKYGHVSLGEVTVDQAVGGARGVKCMLWETSLLDADEGIRFRGHTIPDLQQGPNALPTYSGKEEDEPLPEALIWLLLTGEVPTAEQTKELTDDLHKRAKLPAHVEPMIRAFPKGMHSRVSLPSNRCPQDMRDRLNLCDQFQIMSLVVRLPRRRALFLSQTIVL